MNLYKKITSHISQMHIMREFCCATLALTPFIGQYLNICELNNIRPNICDILFYIFRGQESISLCALTQSPEQHPIPFEWIFLVIASMLSNIDFLYPDYICREYQTIIRSGGEKNWIVGIEIQSIRQTFIFFLCIICIAVITIIFSNGECLLSTPQRIFRVFDQFPAIEITATNVILIGVILPLFALFVINLLQVILSIFFHPLIGILICITVTILSVLFPSYYLCCNAAMIFRGALFSNNGLQPIPLLTVCVVSLIACFLFGIYFFQKFEIYPRLE